MRIYRLGIILLSVVLLSACGAQKKTVKTQPKAEEPVVPAWHTCLIQNAQVTVITDEERLSANATMQVVRDSMIIISVIPMLGIEMMRIEATPLELTAIDKIHGQYAKAQYSDLNRQLTPSINWDILQQICSAELPTGSEKARLVYNYGDERIELVIQYPARKTDVPVKMNAIRKDKYTQIDISRWL